MFNQSKGLENIPTWVISDSRFKEVNVSLKIMFKLESKMATIANVAAKMFADRLEDYPTKKQMLARLDSMYGTRLAVRTYSMGQSQVLDFTARAISKRYVDEDLLQGQIDLIMDCLCRPLFNEQTFLEAKKHVKQDLSHIQENEQYYALVQALKLSGPGQYSGIQAEGNFEDLESITLDELKMFQSACIHRYQKEFYISGDVDADYTLSLPELGIQERQLSLVTNEIVFDTHVVMQQSNQTELVLIYQSEINPHHELYIPYLVFIALLGQGTSSLLFQNVREKHSLCYSIYASQLIFDGLFYIATSVSPEQETQALDLVKAQVKAIQTESFDLDQTKAYLANQLNGTSEDLSRLSQFVFRNNRLQRDDTPEAMIEAIMKVSMADVQKVATLIQGPFIYSYRGVNDEANS